eukprot:1937543-Lingulodinium_polyedra.AAC.1
MLTTLPHVTSRVAMGLALIAGRRVLRLWRVRVQDRAGRPKERPFGTRHVEDGMPGQGAVQ